MTYRTYAPNWPVNWNYPRNFFVTGTTPDLYGRGSVPEVHAALELFLQMIAQFDRAGYSLRTAGNISGLSDFMAGDHGFLGPHTWFFKRKTGGEAQAKEDKEEEERLPEKAEFGARETVRVQVEPLSRVREDLEAALPSYDEAIQGGSEKCETEV